MSDELLTRYQELTARLEKLRREQDQNEGAYRQTLKQLQEQLGVNSLREARRLLKKRKIALVLLEEEYRQGMEAFLEKWNDKLGDDHVS